MSQQDPFLSLSDILYALRKRWKFGLLGGLLLGVLSSLLIVFVMRTTYTSTGSLYVRLGKTTVTIDPTASSSQTISPLESRHQEVVSVKELVSSRAVIERVCQKIGVEKILDQRSPIEKWLEQQLSQLTFLNAKTIPEGLTPEEVARQKALEDAIEYVNDALKVDSPKDSYLINVAVKAHDPVMARDLAQAVLDEYQVVHSIAHKPSGSFYFFDKQVEQLRRRVLELENLKRDELNRRNILSVEAERLLTQSRVAATTNRLSDVMAALEGQRARVAELKSQIDAQAETVEIEQTGGIADAATDQIKSALYNLEVEQQKAAAVYNDSHPVLLQKQQALAEAREIQQTQPNEREQRRNVVNPNRMALQLEYAKGLSELENFESQWSWLEKELDELKLREKQLNEDENFFADLQRQINLAVSEYNAFSTKREQSKVTEAIDQEAFSDVNVAQNASLNLNKSSPSRLLLLIASWMAACIFGAGCAVARELVSGKPAGYRLNGSGSPWTMEEVRLSPRIPVPDSAVPAEGSTSPYRVYSGRIRVQTSNGSGDAAARPDPNGENRTF